MAVPGSKDARLIYRCALQRYDEAKILFGADRTTGAVYLAGYGVECMLKALVLASLPVGRQSEMMKSFRGNRGHDLERLRRTYFENGGARFPRVVARHFILVNDWSTELRYTPRSVRALEAESFLPSTRAIIDWVEGRLRNVDRYPSRRIR